MILVYCRTCGLALRPSDFDRERASVVGGSPYCAPCVPLPERRPLPSPKRRPRPLLRRS